MDPEAPLTWPASEGPTPALCPSHLATLMENCRETGGSLPGRTEHRWKSAEGPVEARGAGRDTGSLLP